jgi:hypothetical protein
MTLLEEAVEAGLAGGNLAVLASWLQRGGSAARGD